MKKLKEIRCYTKDGKLSGIEKYNERGDIMVKETYVNFGNEVFIEKLPYEYYDNGLKKIVTYPDSIEYYKYDDNGYLISRTRYESYNDIGGDNYLSNTIYSDRKIDEKGREIQLKIHTHFTEDDSNFISDDCYKYDDELLKVEFISNTQYIYRGMDMEEIKESSIEREIISYKNKINGDIKITDKSIVWMGEDLTKTIIKSKSRNKYIYKNNKLVKKVKLCNETHKDKLGLSSSSYVVTYEYDEESELLKYIRFDNGRYQEYVYDELN